MQLDQRDFAYPTHTSSCCEVWRVCRRNARAGTWWSKTRKSERRRFQTTPGCANVTRLQVAGPSCFGFEDGVRS